MSKEKNIEKENKKEVKKGNNKKYIILGGVVILVVLAAIIAIFVIDKDDKNVEDIQVSNLTYVAPLKKEDEAKAAKLIKENIVRITNKVNEKNSIVGTGFFIQEGYLVTNSHVVDIMGDINIQYADGNTDKAYLYSNSIENDIAILKVESVPVKALVFGNSNELEVTDDVLAAGFIYNFAGEATVSKGILSARRNSNNFVYLQSDLSIDTGSSGGPLFNANAQVVGINTYVTENRTFSLTLSSEAVTMIIEVLIENPTIEYLTDKRPSNSINKILVEVGYTEDENLSLYSDEKLIKISNDENKDEIEEANKNNSSSSNASQVTYYCTDDDYSLIGSKCVKQVTYEASYHVQSCKNGYTKEGNQCIKSTIVDAKASYYCPGGTLNEENKCVEKSLVVGGGQSVQKRWGSCPKTAKKCYDMGGNIATNALYKKFISEMVCPVGSTKITTATKFVWNGQEINDVNITSWNTKTPGATMKKDKDGTVYYEDVSNVLAMCSKSYDSDKGVHVLYTYDELKKSACPNGGTLTANINNQGFYCLISTDIHMFAWDPVCHDTTFSWIPANGTYYCGRYEDRVYNVNPTYNCEQGSMRADGKTCLVEDIYDLPKEYYCEGSGSLHGDYCIKTKTIDAKKK